MSVDKLPLIRVSNMQEIAISYMNITKISLYTAGGGNETPLALAPR